jgi:hypothetical protein
MSPLEQFFAFSFISVFSVTILATWLRYFPTLIKLYRIVTFDNQVSSKKYSFKG